MAATNREEPKMTYDQTVANYQGYEARAEGKPLESNPYTAVELRDSWIAGWNDAADDFHPDVADGH